MRLAIVRGHRRSAQGAVAADGTTEWQWAGWLASRIMASAMEVGHVARVFERPDRSYSLAMGELVGAVNAWRADLVLSLHFDAAPGGEPWSGTSALHWPGSRDGRTYAVQLSAACSRAIGIRDRGARARAVSWSGAPLYILRDTDAPAVILETHFGRTDHVRAMAALTSGRLAPAIVAALPPVETS